MRVNVQVRLTHIALVQQNRTLCLELVFYQLTEWKLERTYLNQL